MNTRQWLFEHNIPVTTTLSVEGHKLKITGLDDGTPEGLARLFFSQRERFFRHTPPGPRPTETTCSACQKDLPSPVRACPRCGRHSHMTQDQFAWGSVAVIGAIQ